MFLLTVKLLRNSHIVARIFFIFLKVILKKLEIILRPSFNLSGKMRKAVTKYGKF